MLYSPDLRIDLTLAHKDVLIVLAAATALTLFYFIRTQYWGERRASFRPETQREREARVTALESLGARARHEDLASLWLSGARETAWTTTLPVAALKWDVPLFSPSRILPSRHFAERGDGFYELGKSAHDCSQLVEALIEGLQSRLDKTSEVRVVNVGARPRPATGGRPRLATWLANDALLVKSTYDFVDACLGAIHAAGFEALITVEKGEQLAIVLSWQDGTGYETAFEKLVEENSELDCHNDNGQFHLRLWLAFAENRIPDRLLSEPPRSGTAAALF